MSDAVNASRVRKFPAKPDNVCFGCGGANTAGMKLEFEADLETGRVTGRFKIGKDFQGSMGMLHGGITALLMDEAMGKVCALSNVRAVTAELSVKYLRPIQVDQEIVVEAFQVKREGRDMYHEGTISNTAGKVLARGLGRFVVINPEDFPKRDS
nr:PaaI family thioesterase [Candidatus Acidoferrales bacterium]